MKRILTFCIGILLCVGCASTTQKPKTLYDPSKDISPVRVNAKYKPAPLPENQLPFDSGVAMAAIAQLIRGETPIIDNLSIAPDIDLKEPGLPLEHFDLAELTILDRMEKETIKGKAWETKTMAVLTYSLGPFRALVVAEAFCAVTANGVQLTKASVHSISPAKPRVAAWFVPKREFLSAIEMDEALPVWDIMRVANKLAKPVGAGAPQATGDFLAVAVALDRLEAGDSVKAGMCVGPMPDAKWNASVHYGVGFPICITDVKGPLNTPQQEQFFHVMWTPGDMTRSGGVDVPIGRFSTCGTVLTPQQPASAVPSEPKSVIGPLEKGERFLNPTNKSDAMLIQQRLAELGFYSATVDGSFGKGSKAALEKFQKAKSVGAKGNWDLPTQKALFAGTGQ